MKEIERIIGQLGWNQARKTEIVIKVIKEIGINIENCFFDQKDNLIIPMSEIQKLK